MQIKMLKKEKKFLYPAKDCSGYFITKYGEVWSNQVHFLQNPKGELRKRKLRSNRDGYIEVSLSLNGKIQSKKVHRLIALTLIPNPENKPHINHKNGLKTDNRMENLEWCNRHENMQHAWKTGLKKALPGKPVLQYDRNDNFIAEYISQQEAWRQTGVNGSSIGKCCKGYRKTIGGYKWKYKIQE